MRNKKFIILLCFIIFASFLAVACSNDSKDYGDECGVYILNEHSLVLDGGDATLIYGGERDYGAYELDGDKLILKLKNSRLEADYFGTYIKINIDGDELTFYKRLKFNISLDMGEGETRDVEAFNGDMFVPPQPVRSGYTFCGWFRDKDFTLPFLSTERITSDMTLYALWVEEGEEFTVNFDLGNGETLPSRRTVGGKIDLATPVRTDYVFCGWWISDYDDANKLTYACKNDTIIERNITLFALWSEKGVIAPPDVSMGKDGLSWSGVVGANYSISLYCGDDLIDEVPIQSETNYKFDFSSLPAGEYRAVVRCTYGSSVMTVERFYRHKALNSVSHFETDGTVLTFGGVPYAQRYVLSVDCGDESHNHSDVQLGETLFYDFGGCKMQSGGIRFEVTAYADDRLPSLPSVYVYDRRLEPVELEVDEDAEMLTWGRIPHAQSYRLSIMCEDEGHEHETLVFGTSYSLKECSGQIKAEVYPCAEGYNSPSPSTVTFIKSRPASPRDITVANMKVVWKGKATKYNVECDGTVYNVEGKEFDLTALSEDWTAGSEHTVRVRAAGDNASLYSDEIKFVFCAMGKVNYGRGFLEWQPVSGAESYEVFRGGDRIEETTECRIPVTLTGKSNVFAVRCIAGGKVSDFAEVNVDAYAVYFDAMGGSDCEPVYRAAGDRTEFPEPQKSGYDFGGWYDVPSGGEGNGYKYESEIFSESGDLTLYAYWKPKKINITYVYGNAEDVSAPTDFVTLNDNFTLVLPVNRERELVFLGWFTQSQGGERLTDELGVGLAPWKSVEDATVYARYVRALSFTKGNNGKYSVSAGEETEKINKLKIPDTYRDLTDDSLHSVSNIESFSGCSISEIYIPDTVTVISVGAGIFDNCAALRAVNIYETGSVDKGPFVSIDGVLVRKTERDATLEYFPESRSGKYVIPSDVDVIGPSVFAGRKLSEVTVTKNVKAIYGKAFSNCSALRDVVFESGAGGLEIMSLAFENCPIEQIVLPARTTAVRERAFLNCPLRSIEVEKGAKYIASRNGVLVDNSSGGQGKFDRIVCFPSGSDGNAVPSGITVIGKYAFEGCKMTGIDLGGTVEIDEYAFASTPLESLVLPSSVSKVNANAFRDCKQLRSLSIGSGLTEIGDGAFFGCSRLANEGDEGRLVFPASLISIGDEAFSSCAIKYVSFEGNAFESLGNSVFSQCAMLKNVSLPQKIVEIGEGTFLGCSSLSTVTSSPLVSIGKDAFGGCSSFRGGLALSDDETAHGVIGNGAFRGCRFLGEFTVSAAFSVIEQNAFAGCIYLTTVVISDSVTSIGSKAFSGCTSLRTITIGSSVREIGSSAFEDCSALSSVIYNGTASDWDRISVSDRTIGTVKRTYLK